MISGTTAAMSSSQYLQGSEIFHQLDNQINKGDNIYNLTNYTQNLPKGLYLLRLITDGNIIQRKLVVE